ncbi:MAG: cysteine desulfurase family protein [Candidatus Fimimonas sp.]
MLHYFDNCATTKMDESVAETLLKYQTEKYFNPSARSSYSLQVANDIQLARENVQKLLGATGYEVYFTSGGTESDNLGIVGSLKSKRGNIVATMSEHSAVYNTLMELQNKGYEVRLANVLADGHIDVDDFLSKVDNQTLLACCMHVNNETGAVNDVKSIVKAVKSLNPSAVCFSDGVQAVGKIPVNLSDLGVDIYTLAGHKFHSGKGIGALFVKKGVRLTPLVFGGGQEKGIRSGTENVGGIMALAQALQTAVQNVSSNTEKFLRLKQILRNSLSDVPGWQELCTQNSSPAIFTVAFVDIKGEVLLHMLEQFEIIVGTGSACSSKNKQSRIAKAIGLPKNFTEGVLRISFCKYNTLEETEILAEKLRLCVLQLRKTMLG